MALMLGDDFVGADGTRWVVVGAARDAGGTIQSYHCAEIPAGETVMSMGRTWDNRTTTQRVIPVSGKADGWRQ